MKGYYAVKPNGEKFLDIPNVAYVFEKYGRLYFLCDKERIDVREIFWKNENESDYLERTRQRGWKIEEIEVSENYKKWIGNLVEGKERRGGKKFSMKDLRTVVKALYRDAKKEFKKQRRIRLRDGDFVNEAEFDVYWWMRGEEPNTQFWDSNELDYKDSDEDYDPADWWKDGGELPAWGEDE